MKSAQPPLRCQVLAKIKNKMNKKYLNRICKVDDLRVNNKRSDNFEFRSLRVVFVLGFVMFMVWGVLGQEGVNDNIKYNSFIIRLNSEVDDNGVIRVPFKELNDNQIQKLITEKAGNSPQTIQKLWEALSEKEKDGSYKDTQAMQTLIQALDGQDNKAVREQFIQALATTSESNTPEKATDNIYDLWKQLETKDGENLEFRRHITETLSKMATDGDEKEDSLNVLNGFLSEVARKPIEIKEGVLTQGRKLEYDKNSLFKLDFGKNAGMGEQTLDINLDPEKIPSITNKIMVGRSGTQEGEIPSNYVYYAKKADGTDIFASYNIAGMTIEKGDGENTILAKKGESNLGIIYPGKKGHVSFGKNHQYVTKEGDKQKGHESLNGVRVYGDSSFGFEHQQEHYTLRSNDKVKTPNGIHYGSIAFSDESSKEIINNNDPNPSIRLYSGILELNKEPTTLQTERYSINSGNIVKGVAFLTNLYTEGIMPPSEGNWIAETTQGATATLPNPPDTETPIQPRFVGDISGLAGTPGAVIISPLAGNTNQNNFIAQIITPTTPQAGHFALSDNQLILYDGQVLTTTNPPNTATVTATEASTTVTTSEGAKGITTGTTTPGATTTPQRVQVNQPTRIQGQTCKRVNGRGVCPRN
jgi:hypothetical protein